MSSIQSVILRRKGHLKYLNGDQYYGEYMADVLARNAYRHGCGTYVTAKCCTYQGKWAWDKLTKCAYIKYLSDQTFCGELDAEGYYKKGTVDFVDGCKLHVDYSIRPHLRFEDINGCFWDVEMGENALMLTNK